MTHRSLLSRYAPRGVGGWTAIVFTLALTLSWVLWEVGYNGLALVARVVAQASPVPTAFAGIGVVIGLMLFAHYSTARDLLPPSGDFGTLPGEVSAQAAATPVMVGNHMLAYALAGN